VPAVLHVPWLQEYYTLNSCSLPCENAAQCSGSGLDYNGLRNPVLGQFNMVPCNMRSDSRTGNGERFYNCEPPLLQLWQAQSAAASLPLTAAAPPARCVQCILDDCHRHLLRAADACYCWLCLCRR
jgi:hypothetical protein